MHIFVRKTALRVVLFLVVIFLIIWLLSVIKCEVYTFLYGNEFSEVYHENAMIGEQKEWKVLEYTDSYAVVYFIEQNKSYGNVLSFTKLNGQWAYDQWLETVWSKSGSADGFIWPYGR